MPTVVCKFHGKYFTWTTVADGPCTTPMSAYGMLRHLIEDENFSWDDAIARMQRTDDNETRLTLDELKAWMEQQSTATKTNRRRAR